MRDNDDTEVLLNDNDRLVTAARLLSGATTKGDER